MASAYFRTLRFLIVAAIAVVTVSTFLLQHYYVGFSAGPTETVQTRLPPSLQTSSSSYVLGNQTTLIPESVCLTQQCFRDVGRQLARAWHVQAVDSWCISPRMHRQNNSPVGLYDRKRASLDPATQKWRGLLLVKVPKAASSTVAGVALRLAEQQNCAVQYEHRLAYLYENRTTSRSLLFSSVRDPATRSLSAVWFFMVSPMNFTPTDKNIIRSLNTAKGGRTKGKGGYQYNYMSLVPVESRSVWLPSEPTKIIHPNALHNKIRQLIESYDFIIVVERMDESLTALALVAGVPLTDVLVTSSKVAGNYLLGQTGKTRGICYKPKAKVVSAGVQAYFDSDEWLARNYADYVLHQAVNASLDLTIKHQIGYDKFDVALQEFKRLKRKAQDVCGHLLGFGCTADGHAQPDNICYELDFGCGYQCVNRMLQDEAANGQSAS